VAFINPVPPIARILREPAVRALYAWLPAWARPPAPRWGAVMKVRLLVAGCVAPWRVVACRAVARRGAPCCVVGRVASWRASRRGASCVRRCFLG
jgi:hypothetical protein